MKRIICCIISFLLVLSMASCGKAQPEPEPPSITDKLSSLCLEYGYLENGGYRLVRWDDDLRTMMMYPEEGGECIYFICENDVMSTVMQYKEGSLTQPVMTRYFGSFTLHMKGVIGTNSYNYDNPEIFNISGCELEEDVTFFHASVNLMMANINLLLLPYNISLEDLGFINY